MMKQLFILSLFLLISCKSDVTPDDSRFDELQARVDSMSMMLDSFNSNVPGHLVHQVFLDTKAGIDQDEFLSVIRTLKHIPEVRHLRIGSFKDLNDDRALKNYELIMEMNFENSDAYESYQNNQIHLDMKTSLAKYLERPPMTFDFIIE